MYIPAHKIVQKHCVRKLYNNSQPQWIARVFQTHPFCTARVTVVITWPTGMRAHRRVHGGSRTRIPCRYVFMYIRATIAVCAACEPCNSVLLYLFILYYLYTIILFYSMKSHRVNCTSNKTKKKKKRLYLITRI